MRKLSLITLLAAALSAAFSCAKTETEDTAYLEEMSFEAWMEKYVNKDPQNIVAAKQENGIYIEFINDGDQTKDSARDTVVWLRMNYTATDLNKKVFATRSENEALKQATFTPHTHYAPDYLFCGDQNLSMIDGQYYALKNDLIKPDGSKVKLGEGAQVRIYMPSYLAFGKSGFSDDQGYGGQYKLSGTRPIIQHLELVEVVKDPVLREENLVNKYAADNWGMTEADTTAACFYIDTILFNQELALRHGGVDQSLPWDEKYALTADSTAKVWFVQKFLDDSNNFILKTNIDTVYNRFYNRRALEGYYDSDFPAYQKKLTVMTYKPADDKDSDLSAFYTAIPNLRKGQWSRIIFTSAYAYGSSGQSAALQQQTDYWRYYMSYLQSASYYGGGYGYGSGYYGNSYYDSYNYNYNSMYNTSTSTEKKLITEVQPYTPLVFEIYIEADDE